MKLDPMLQPLAELAPEGMPWLCVAWSGHAWYQTSRGDDCFWIQQDENSDFAPVTQSQEPEFECGNPFAINLKTGTIHLQQPDGTIVEVSQSEWSGMP